MSFYKPISGSDAAARGGPLDALRKVLRSVRWTAAATALVSAGINLLMLVTPIYMMQVYDRVIATRHIDTLIYLTLIALVALAAFALLDYARGLVGHRLGAWIERRLADDVVAATVNAAHFGAASRGVQGLRDLAQLRALFANGGLWPLLDAPWMPIFFLVIYLIHPVLFWCGVAGGGCLLLLALANELLTRSPVKRAAAGSIIAQGAADAAVRNADTMIAMGLLPRFIERWRSLNDLASAPQLAAGERSAAVGAAAKFIRLALQVLVLALGAYLVTRGEITAGAMLAASILMARAVGPLEQAITTWRGLLGAQAAYRRLLAQLVAAPAPQELIRLPRPQGRVGVSAIEYVVPGSGASILRGVSFTVEPGESLGVIGPSGAGKTTLLRLLVGSLVPQGGSVRLDGAAIHQLAAEDKAQHIGYLPQDIELFNTSVRDNIARFSGASDEEVIAAAQLAGAHEAILALPQGYATILGPGGVTLSGGQRQRIGLARALFADPRLVVLDEPNSNLDVEGEKALVAALRRLRERGVTVLLVAQRLSLASEVDLILMLRGGRVEALERREDVMAVAARSNAAVASELRKGTRAVPAARPAVPDAAMQRVGA